jgi:ubiquinone/menaquinone biosynthesis C-methylase UbiE
MTNTNFQEINHHYTQTDLSAKILKALSQAGKDINTLTREDIATFDEFHIRGREATREIAKLADLQPGEEILDLGCGIGGAARTLMSEFDCRVTGIDLVDEYIQTARILNSRIGYDGKITFKQANALHLPFDDASFDVVFSQHITMNVEDKTLLAKEVRRVLRPNGRFVHYEIFAGSVSTPYFPVPWAGDPTINFLVEPQTFQLILEETGFKSLVWRDVTPPSLEWNMQLAANISNRPADAPPPIGLNLLMGENTGEKVRNMMMNMQEDRIQVYQGVMGLSD